MDHYETNGLTFYPRSGRILVRMTKLVANTKIATSGGEIELGEVVAIASDLDQNSFKKGELIYFPKDSGTEINLDSDILRFIEPKDIVSVIKYGKDS